MLSHERDARAYIRRLLNRPAGVLQLRVCFAQEDRS
jgi:hypothetical protein